jgi:hypothetical protein
MVFAVVVDIPPVEAAAAARALATCNAALGPEQCTLASATPSSQSPAHWYAVVRYGPDGQRELTIELYERTRNGTRVASSELEFKERDSQEERWASAGVVVAALVLAQPPPANRAEQKRALEKPAPAQPAALVPAAPAGRQSPWLRLDLGITAGSEMQSAPLRVGPLGRFGLAFANVPLFAFASGAYTVRSSEGTDLNWLTGSLGAGVRVGFARQRAFLEARAEAVIERLGVQATDGQRTESAHRIRFGPRLGLDLGGYWAENWALLVGVEAGALSPRVILDVQGQTQELPPFAWGLLSALRYDFR